jgi:tryptophan-rich sensory protein
MAFMRWAVVTVPFILLLGLASARFAPTGAQNSWYMHLAKPDHMPPDWAFLAGWIAIYVLIGLALAMVINARGSRLRTPALILFAVQMAVNLGWMPLFFLSHLVTAALITIAVLSLLALLTTAMFFRIRVGAAVLLLPYLAWIAYAGFLLYQMHQLNPNAESVVPSRSSDQIRI